MSMFHGNAAVPLLRLTSPPRTRNVDAPNLLDRGSDPTLHAGAADPEPAPMSTRSQARAPAVLSLSRADFDAQTGRSSAHGAARVEVARRMQAWADRVIERVAAMGLELTAAADQEDAAQAVVLADVGGPPGERIRLRIEATGVEVVLVVDGDRARRWAEAFGGAAEHVSRAWDALPEPVRAGPEGAEARPAHDLVVADVERLAREGLEGGRSFVVGWRMARGEAQLGGKSASSALADVAVSLGALWQAVREAGHARRPPLRRRPILASRSRARGAGAIEKGAAVRATEGPFAGQSGVVQELDGRGGARVLFGLLAVRVDLAQLVPASGRRPVLSSSHRKPQS